MSLPEEIKTSMQRGMKAVKLKPAVGIGKETMRIETTPDGMTKAVDGDYSVMIDLSGEYGGSGSTPSPGVLVRAALGACLSQGYMVWAAFLGVEIGKINVEIESQYDMRGNYGLDPNIRAGITSLHYKVSIESAADPEKVRQLVDQSDAIDFVRDIFAGELAMTREIQILPLPEITQET